MKVSIIVPVHNTEKYLRQCVGSLLSQTLDDIEVVLVENGSEDGSPDICRELSSEDPRVRYVTLEKGDLSTARNEGVRAAAGEYVGFVDSDDLVSPEMYGCMYEAAVRNGADAVNCNYVKIYNNGRPPKYQYCEDGTERVMTPAGMIALNMREEISQSACTLLVRKSIVSEIGFCPGVRFEDRRTTFLFYAASSSCVQINRSMYYYHQYRGGIVKKGRRNFRTNYDCADADRIRLAFIRDSGLFTPGEQVNLSSKSAESFLRKLNRMRREISCAEEREMLRGIMPGISLIPDGCRLSLKAKVIRHFVRRILAADR